MRKAAMLLSVILLLAVFTACSPEKPVYIKGPDAVQALSADSGTISSFLRDMLNYKAELWKKLEQKYKGSEYAPEFNSINAPDYSITILPMYDTLALTGSGKNRREGQLMVSGIPAYEEVNGSILTFGFEYTYENDTGYYKKGAVETAKGELDFSRNTLIYEDMISTDGKADARTIIEIVRLADKSYAYQYIYGNEKDKKATAVFSTLSESAYTALCGSKQDGALFSYRSIRYGSATLEQMAEGFTVRLAAAANKDGAEMAKK